VTDARAIPCGMDAGLAAILGAAIGLLGSAVVPWVREHFEFRAQRKREHRDELRAAVREVVASTTEVFRTKFADRSRELVGRSFAASTQFGLLVEPADAEMARVVDEATMAMWGDELSERLASFKALIDVLAPWYRGEMTALEASQKYDETYRHLFLAATQIDSEKKAAAAADALKDEEGS
jgi:hypothetical protein